ncbi:phosphoribosyltransferase-like protein [Mycolicibacterium sp. Dal123E01]|uniref:phosphoribosyltransferase-like protein n=1 Tax=Mycolicibacterium sp. Dal123E01 TaxID=3457578 RepID=UPI00403E7E39
MDRLDVLSANVWDGAINRVDIENWLANFDGSKMPVDEEHLNSIHLLANFNLFGITEVRQLLKTMFRDLFRYPIIQEIRSKNGNTLDNKVVAREWRRQLQSTRFLGMGNPSESGAHLLYYFRQENRLSKDFFLHQHQILNGPVGDTSARLIDSSVTRLVFIDDVLGSGEQAEDYSAKFVSQVKQAAKAGGNNLVVEYFVLFAKEEGLRRARSTEFDRVEAVHEIQASELAFSDNSRIYAVESDGITKEAGLKLASHYGSLVCPEHPLGYKGGQMLLGFRHNIPDNTLPIIWSSEGPHAWIPAFPRYGKF